MARKLSNKSLLMQGANNVTHGSDTTQGGLAQMVIGWADFLDTPLRYTVGEGDAAESGVFTPLEYATKPADKAIRSAQLAAMMVDLFGCDADNIPGSLKVALNDTLAPAVAIRHFYGDKLFLAETYGDSGKARLCVGGVPAKDVFDLLENLPEGEAPKLNKRGRYASAKLQASCQRESKSRKLPSADALMAYTLACPMVIDGKVDPTFMNGKVPGLKEWLSTMRSRGVSAGLLPEKAERKRDGAVDASTAKRKGFDAKLAQVKDWVAMIAKPDGEVEVAPTKDQEQAMVEIAQGIALYFAANPRLI